MQVIVTGKSRHYSDTNNDNNTTANTTTTTNNNNNNNNNNDNNYKYYMQYLEHLRSRLFPLTLQEQYESPYYDNLLAPLQPLMDNLESQTYETFEQDPIKYSQYEIAITAALNDTPPEKETILMVVGAGRGPLVRRAINASLKSARRLRIYAVEKNPNAVITLRNLIHDEQWTNVTVINSDMREWNAPEKADILVSELLGSFGDNELSPECLDGAQKFLKKDGISIPYQYTSYIAPVSSHKLWRLASQQGHDVLKNMETAYVVKMHNHYQLAEAKPCFTFVHPNKDEQIDNSRFINITFDITSNNTIHGFGGYFEALLYKDIAISIVPQTFSTGMFSWFPIFFPLINPIYGQQDSKVEVQFWRNVNKNKVWYEWSMTSPAVTPIHNPNGRSYWIGL